VYYRIGKAHGQAQADAALHNLRRLPVAILEVDETAVLAAASLKMRLAISYADAFAVAAALRQDAVLLTGDPELVSLEGQFPIEKLSRKSRS
jgi:predicted nucleic acid-binding protein